MFVVSLLLAIAMEESSLVLTKAQDVGRACIVWSAWVFQLFSLMVKLHQQQPAS